MVSRFFSSVLPAALGTLFLACSPAWADVIVARFKRRWKIERTNRWIFNFRRLVVRYEHLIEMTNERRLSWRCPAM